MKRHILPLVAAAAAGALLVPAVFAATPHGNGLYGEHWSHCTGAFTYDGYVTLVPGNGNSFWVNGNHLVIQSATVTDSATNTIYEYTFGVKAGQASGPMVTCVGDFPGYHVVSHDVVVP
ncbi:MAG: hypothetical protein ACXVRK_00135 [Gaiellaceae bacterium]